MDGWWWLPIGLVAWSPGRLVAWFAVAMAVAVALLLGPVLRSCAQAREALD